MHHHATASSYKNILEYFTPSFLLGLTATPNRMDNEDVFKLFNNYIPFELSLREALLLELVIPFKYYGIKDGLIDFTDRNTNLIKGLSNSIHTDFIRYEIEKRRINCKLKALAFCKSVEHTRTLAEAMSIYGYHTSKNKNKLYYFKKDNLEIDFVTKYNNQLTLIEVKSTNSKSKSLNEAIKKYSIKSNYKLIDGNIGSANAINTIPLYIAFLLNE